jgi:hypothetical protein
MARRAEQVERCPWCAGSLRPGASECPDCLFPLTMAAIGTSGRSGAVEARGTSSTASPAHTPLPARFHVPQHSLGPPSRSHRLRMVSWLLAVMAGLLVVAGVASWISLAGPDGRSDATAQTNLLVALSRAQGRDRKPGLEVVELPGDDASDTPGRLSVSESDGFWFGAAQSTSGRCFVLGWRFDGATDVLGGTLAKGDPCTASEVRASPLGLRLEAAGAAKKP